MQSDALWYWALDLPGLSKRDAQSVLQAAKNLGHPLAFTVDPSQFLTMHLDRDSVETICRGLAHLDGDDAADALREDLREWLDRRPA